MARLMTRAGNFAPLKGIKRRVVRDGSGIEDAVRDEGDPVEGIDKIYGLNNPSEGKESDTTEEKLEVPSCSAESSIVLCHDDGDDLDASEDAEGESTKQMESRLPKPFYTYNWAGQGFSVIQANFEKLTQEGAYLLNYYGTMPKGEQYAEFIFFPKLPLEVQRMIWDFAAEEPCTIALKCSLLQSAADSDAKVRTVLCQHAWRKPPRWALRAACVEARSAVARCQDDLFTWETEREYGPHANWDVDTLWIAEPDGSSEYIGWMDAFMFVLANENTTNFDVRTIAMSYELWIRYSRDPTPHHPGWFFDIMEDLYNAGVEEILLVVGGHANCAHPDVIFQRPKKLPSHKKSFYSFDPWMETSKKFSSPGIPWTWQALEEDAIETIQKFQIERAKARESYIEEGKDDQWLADMNLEDCSHWTINRVRYVEAVLPSGFYVKTSEF